MGALSRHHNASSAAALMCAPCRTSINRTHRTSNGDVRCGQPLPLHPASARVWRAGAASGVIVLPLCVRFVYDCACVRAPSVVRAWSERVQSRVVSTGDLARIVQVAALISDPLIIDCSLADTIPSGELRDHAVPGSGFGLVLLGLAQVVENKNMHCHHC